MCNTRSPHKELFQWSAAVGGARRERSLVLTGEKTMAPLLRFYWIQTQRKAREGMTTEFPIALMHFYEFLGLSLMRK